MSTVLIPYQTTARLVKSFNKANPDCSHTIISWDSTAKALTIDCHGNNIGLSFTIPGSKLSVQATKDTSCTVQTKLFINALNALNTELTTSIKILSNSLVISSGNKQIKISTETIQPFNASANRVLIKEIPTAALTGIVDGIKPISNVNAITVFKEGFIMTVDSFSRETICISKLVHVLPKDVSYTPNGTGQKPVTVPCVMGMRSKDLECVANTFFLFSNAIAGEKIELHGNCNTNSFSSVTFKAQYSYVDSPDQDTVQITARLLDDDKYKKEVSILDKAVKFTPMFKLTVPVQFVKSVSNAKVVDTEAKLHVSNKLNPCVINITTPSGSYEDQMELQTTCKFDIVIRNNAFEWILDRFEGPIDLWLHDKMPIVSLSPNNLDTYLVSCFNSPLTNLPFEVTELAPAKQPEVSNATKEDAVVGTQ